MRYEGVETYCIMMQGVKKPRPKTMNRDQLGKLMLIQFGAATPGAWRRHLEIMVTLGYLKTAGLAVYEVNWKKLDEDYEKVNAEA